MHITVNGQRREMAAPMPLGQLLVELNLPSKHVAVEVNLELMPRARHSEYVVQSGDKLEVVTLAGGG